MHKQSLLASEIEFHNDIPNEIKLNTFSLDILKKEVKFRLNVNDVNICKPIFPHRFM